MKVRELLEGDVINIPIKKKDLEKVELSDIFSSQIYNIVKKDIGIEFAEKPGYFSDINNDSVYKQISEVQLRKLQNILVKKNLPALKEYSSKKIYGSRGLTDKDGGFGPLASHQWLPNERTFIIKFDNGHRYLVDTSGAKSYIRTWLRIKEAN